MCKNPRKAYSVGVYVCDYYKKYVYIQNEAYLLNSDGANIWIITKLFLGCLQKTKTKLKQHIATHACQIKQLIFLPDYNQKNFLNTISFFHLSSKNYETVAEKIIYNNKYLVFF